MSTETKNKTPDLVAYQVTESGEKAFYHRIGAGWTNRYGGAKVKLDALPLSGEILLLPPKARDEA